MSEDAPVNTGAVNWPDPDSAYFTVRRMQTKLHHWATQEPGRRFGDLHNLVYDPAFLMAAWERVSTNKGAKTPGIDKATAAQIETWIGVEAFLSQIRNSLKSGEFRPVEVRQVMIPKANGKLRRLGIPTIADRVVQASLKLVLEPIFEADFKPSSYGFRPNRRAQDAISEIHIFSTNKYEWVLECDIKACFDEISHTALMDRFRVRIKDKRVCSLVKAFLKSGVFTELGSREESLTGTPQGGILSPLLANIALSALDDHFDQQWQQEMDTQMAAGKAQEERPRKLATRPLLRRFRPHGGGRPTSCRGPARGGVGRARTPGATAGTGEDPGGPHRRGLHVPRLRHPPDAQARDVEVSRLHHTVQEGHRVDQGQGEGQDVQVNPPHGPGPGDP